VSKIYTVKEKLINEEHVVIVILLRLFCEKKYHDKSETVDIVNKYVNKTKLFYV